MTYKKGDKVVYPQQGVGTLTDIEQLTVAGETRLYYAVVFQPMPMNHRDLLIKIPVDKAEDIGLRSVIPADELTDVYDLLDERNVRQPANFSRRYKNYVERIATGDIYQIAEVVRNLSLRPKLSLAERELLAQARHYLVAEVAVAAQVDPEEAAALVAAHLPDGTHVFA